MRIGPYRVQEQLGEGGAGVVYRAQADDGSLVALKLLRGVKANDRVARKRFRREAEALARLDHPHVVKVLGAGDHEGTPWLALELVKGESLESRLRHEGQLPITEAVRITEQLAQALLAVHGEGLLHRDLKPDNVLCRGDDVLLTDFGLVRDTASSRSGLTLKGALLGTPGYWAPEQAQGDSDLCGTPTDVYGLGAVLYACLTGRPPVLGKSLVDFLRTVRYMRLRSPRRLRPEVPDWLSALTMRCLRLVPHARPSLEEILRDLDLGPDAPEEEDGFAHSSVVPKSEERSPPWLWLGLGGVLPALFLGFLGARWARGPASDPPPAVDVVKEVVEPSQGAETPERRDPEAPPPAAPPLHRTALGLLDADDYTGARALLDQHLETSPHDAFALGLSAIALAGDCEFTLATTQLRAARDEGLTPAQTKELSSRFPQTWLLLVRPDYDALAPYARELTEQRSYLRARRCYDELIRLAPTPLPLLQRSRCHTALLDYDAALSDLTRALRAAAEVPALEGELLHQRALAYARLGEAELADADRRRASSLAAAGYCEAKLLAERIEANLALAEHRAARLDGERRARARELTKGAASLLANGGAERAIGLCAQALEADPLHAEAYFVRGQAKARAKAKDYAGVLADMTLGLELDPRCTPGLEWQGWALNGLERYAEASVAYRRAVDLGARINPETLANVYYRAGRHDEALEVCDAAQLDGASGGRLLAVRGAALYAQKRYVEAVAAWDRALAPSVHLDPETRAQIETYREQARLEIR